MIKTTKIIYMNCYIYNRLKTIIVIKKFHMKLNNLKLSVLLSIAVLILSCNYPLKGQEVKQTTELKKTSVNKIVPPGNTDIDDLASFIAGIPASNKNKCYARLDTTVKWINYAKELNKMFARADTFRFVKMKSWADSELIKNHSIKTVFYPFSGPDFLNANIFYPDVDQYIMIAMEPIGYLPNICGMHTDSVNSYLNTVNNSLTDIFKRSYFITKTMDTDLRTNKVHGAIPLISLFIKRTGHQIVSFEKVGIDSLGKMKMLDNYNDIKGLVPGIKVNFNSLSDKKTKSVYYFRTDISDKGLAKNKGFKTYMSGLPKSFTYLKAASYLMHGSDFKVIRDLVFEISSTILQDDSGIAYNLFDKTKWDIKLYGKYYKPSTEFSYISEPTLEKAYKTSEYRPISFSLGYNWRSEHSNMLYAVRK